MGMWRMSCMVLVASSVAYVVLYLMMPASREELAYAFQGKRIALCGASYGIGAEIAFSLARAGARLSLSARGTEKLQRVADKCMELGAKEVVVHAHDLSKEEESKAFVDATVRDLGGIDVLILNHVVGMFEDWALTLTEANDSGELEGEMARMRALFAVNTFSYIYLSSYALGSLARTGGRVVVVGSFAGVTGLPRVAPYSATKHALFGYFNSLRHDLRASPNPSLRNVSVTAVVLGQFATESALSATAGVLDHLVFYPPSEAADSLLTGVARGWETVYAPWLQIRPAMCLSALFPETMAAIVRLSFGL